MMASRLRRAAGARQHASRALPRPGALLVSSAARAATQDARHAAAAPEAAHLPRRVGPSTSSGVTSLPAGVTTLSPSLSRA
jgi:hypothetical protein